MCLWRKSKAMNYQVTRQMNMKPLSTLYGIFKLGWFYLNRLALPNLGAGLAFGYFSATKN